MDDEKKDSLISGFIRTFKRAKPSARIVFVLIGVAFTAFVITFASYFLSSDGEEKVMPKETSNVKTLGGKDAKEAAIITDTTTKLGKIAVKAEQARVRSEASKGKSAFQKIVQDEEPVIVEKTISEKPKPKPEKNTNDSHIAKKIETRKTKEKVILNDGLLKSLKTETNVDDNNTGSRIIKRKTPGNADIYSKDQLRKDPIAGLQHEQYYGELKLRKESLIKQLQAAYSVQKKQRSYTSGGLKPYAVPPTENTASNNPRREGYSNTTDQNGNEQALPMLFQPGDKITAYSDWPVDSRVNKQMVFRVSSKIMEDARINCTFVDKGDFLIPICKSMTYKNKVKPIDAIVLNPKNLSGIIDQDVDDDLFIKTTSRIAAGIFNIYGAAKLATGNKTTETENSVTTENTLSDKDIVAAGLASTIGDIGMAGEAYYSQPAVKTISAHTQVLITFAKPLPDHWGIAEKNNTDNGVW